MEIIHQIDNPKSLQKIIQNNKIKIMDLSVYPILESRGIFYLKVNILGTRLAPPKHHPQPQIASYAFFSISLLK